MHTLAQETDPPTNQVIASASALAATSKRRMEREAEAASAASPVAVGNLVVLIILTIPMVAYILSRQRAESLALSLDCSVQTDPVTDVEGDDAISGLTRSFNTMRALGATGSCGIAWSQHSARTTGQRTHRTVGGANDSLSWGIA